MDGGWATGGQKFKRRILDVSMYIDPFNFTSGKHQEIFYYYYFNTYVKYFYFR